MKRDADFVWIIQTSSIAIQKSLPQISRPIQLHGMKSRRSSPTHLGRPWLTDDQKDRARVRRLMRTDRYKYFIDLSVDEHSDGAVWSCVTGKC